MYKCKLSSKMSVFWIKFIKKNLTVKETYENNLNHVKK